jgi:hypothetical protein
MVDRGGSADLDPETLNEGLDLAMEWGDAWLEPIQGRLANLRSGLTDDELDRYDERCRAAMEHGHQLVYQLMERHQLQPGVELRTRFQEELLSRHPWISEDNLGRLYSQGCYYAWK